MKKTHLYFVLLFCSMLLAKEPIVFAPLPMQDKNTILRQFYPMIEYLQKKTKREFKVSHYKNYETLLDNFIQGNIDLIYLGPLPFVTLQEKYPDIEPLVFFKDKDGASFYTCSLIAFMDNDIDFTQPIKDKKIALTQPLSTCGYLGVSKILQLADSNIEENHYNYVCRHDTVALHVAQKKAELGGLKTSIAKQYHGIGIDILATTDPMPMFVLAGNTKTLSFDTLQAIQSILLKTPLSQYKNWGEKIRYGTKKASLEDYKYLIEIKKGLDIPQKGNTPL